MIVFKTALKQTVTLVESRVANNSSPDVWKDLTFLAEHYRNHREWSKADAVTRHMLAVAEGNTTSMLQLTPIDIDRHLNKTYLHYQQCLGFWLTMASLLVLTLLYLAIDELRSNPKIFLDLRAQIFQTDPQTFVDRSNYFLSRSEVNEALRECDK
ncbi:MAG TPA: hypothetical protein V6C89_20115 [Drouetiella sp.]|jgi:hypothetical protein